MPVLAATCRDYALLKQLNDVAADEYVKLQESAKAVNEDVRGVRQKCLLGARREGWGHEQVQVRGRKPASDLPGTPPPFSPLPLTTFPSPLSLII